MATETLDEKTPGAGSPAKDELGVVDASKVEEVADPPRNDDAEKKEEAESKEGELEDKGDVKDEEEEGEGSGSKKEAVTPSSDRPTRERKQVERFSSSGPVRVTPSKSVSIEKVSFLVIIMFLCVLYSLALVSVCVC